MKKNRIERLRAETGDEKAGMMVEETEVACDYTKRSEINTELIRECKLEEYIENYVKHQEKKM